MKEVVNSGKKSNGISLIKGWIVRAIAIMGLVVCFCGYASARKVHVEIANVRSNKGNVLVMIQQGKESKPLYGLAKAVSGKVIVDVDQVEWDHFDLSAFHDENGNMKMDYGDKGPVEGYVLKNCKLKSDEDAIKVNLFYPSEE